MKVITVKGSAISLGPGIQLDRAMLRDLDLRGIDLSNSVLTNCFFNESLLNESSLRSCDLSGSVFYRTDLSGADLGGATLNDCYWNEVRYSKSTIWPIGFLAPGRPDPLEDVIIAAECSNYDSGLCSLTELDVRDLVAEVARLYEFTAGFEVGPIRSADERKRLVLRLAEILTRGYLATESEDNSIFLNDDPNLDIDQFRKNWVFTHIVLMLRFIGIQFLEVKENGSVMVSFDIGSSVADFLENDVLAVFEIAMSRAIALGEVDRSTSDEVREFNFEDDLISLRELVNRTKGTRRFRSKIERISGNQKFFESAYSIDFSEFKDPDEGGFVALIDYAGPVLYSCEEKLVLAMLAYTNFAREDFNISEFEVDADDELDNDDDLDGYLLAEEDDEFADDETEDGSFETINCEFHLLVLRLLGIIAIEESISGTLHAEIRPQLSLSTSLKELGYEVADDFEDGDEDFVVYPTLGLFDQLFEF